MGQLTPRARLDRLEELLSRQPEPTDRHRQFFAWLVGRHAEYEVVARVAHLVSDVPPERANEALEADPELAAEWHAVWERFLVDVDGEA